MTSTGHPGTRPAPPRRRGTPAGTAPRRTRARERQVRFRLERGDGELDVVIDPFAEEITRYQGYRGRSVSTTENGPVRRSRERTNSPRGGSGDQRTGDLRGPAAGAAPVAHVNRRNDPEATSRAC